MTKPDLEEGIALSSRFVKSAGQRGPADPDRPTKIARAALAIATERGLGQLSHRTVAQEAGVPLGSTTYHFSNLHDLVAAGMSEAVEEFREVVERWSRTLTQANVVPKLARLIHGQITPGDARRRTIVGYELCVMAMRFDDLKAVNDEWDSILPTALEKHVSATQAHSFNIVVNGIMLDALIHDRTPKRADIEAQLRQAELT